MPDYVLEIHTDKKRLLKRVPEEFVPYRAYFRCFGEYKELKKKARRLRRKGWVTLLYSKQHARSDTYRAEFFNANPPDEKGRYQCVYCGRRQSHDKITVDHVISVGSAKKSGGRGLGGRDVNDISNLVPACSRCNMRKGADSSLIWRLKARLGKHPAWHWIRRGIIAIVFFALIVLAVKLGLIQYLIDLFRGNITW